MASASAEGWRRRLGHGLVGLWCSLCSLLAPAHPMPESQLWLDTTPSGVIATLQMPLSALEVGYGQPLADAPAEVLARHAAGLARYLLQHLGARSAGEGGAGSAQGWQVLAPRLRVLGQAPTAELEAVMELRAPPGADARRFTLLLDAITHEERTHRVTVFLRNDWRAGRVGGVPRPLGEVRYIVNTVAISLPDERAGSGWGPLFKAGALHIAEGADHLLFLLLLVIVAPLGVREGRWGEVRPVRVALRQLAFVVTAFTVGHTLTLVLGSSGWLVLPPQPVEVAVALSIAVAAVHAARPLRRQGEVAMALGFGLVHGFAFSASLSGAGLTAWQHAQALLAFNLGIEAMQLGLLVAVMPPLLWACRVGRKPYAVWRGSVAIAALALSLLWVVDRLGLGRVEAVSVADGASWIPMVAVAAVWSLALLLLGWRQVSAELMPP